MKNRTAFSSLLALSLVALAPAASAAPSAEEHFKTGLKHFDQGNYEAARQEFLKAQAITPRASVLRNLALSELHTNRPLDALEHLRAYLADASVSAAKRELAKQNYEEAFSRTGHIRLRTSDGATVLVDGQPWTKDLKDSIDVLPGNHALEARVGERNRRRDVDAPAGIVVDAELLLDEAPATTVPTSAIVVADGVDSPKPETPPVRQDVAEDGSSTRRLIGGSVGLLGVVLVGVGVGFAVDAGSKSSSADALRGQAGNCSNADSSACQRLRELRSSYDSDKTAETILFPLGGIAIAAGIALVVWPSSGARITPSVSKQGASLSFGLPF
jgi:hypothetical protein